LAVICNYITMHGHMNITFSECSYLKVKDQIHTCTTKKNNVVHLHSVCKTTDLIFRHHISQQSHSIR